MQRAVATLGLHCVDTLPCILLMVLSLGGHRGYSYLSAVLNNATMNIPVQVKMRGFHRIQGDTLWFIEVPGAGLGESLSLTVLQLWPLGMCESVCVPIGLPLRFVWEESGCFQPSRLEGVILARSLSLGFPCVGLIQDTSHAPNLLMVCILALDRKYIMCSLSYAEAPNVYTYIVFNVSFMEKILKGNWVVEHRTDFFWEAQVRMTLCEYLCTLWTWAVTSDG